jgi:hypothetical protein
MVFAEEREKERERERMLHSKYDLRITMIVVSPHRQQNWCAWPLPLQICEVVI